MDPRLSIIDRRLESVRRIIAFASGKGGVGKSSCSSVSALLLARQGMRVGLLDLDFHGASDHVILGVDPELPDEAGGITPLEAAYGIRFMGIAPFTGDHGVALRGDAITDAIRELLAVVIWGELDVLVVDMPPGIGDPILDLSRHLGRSEMVMVSTPQALSIQIMNRLLEVLRASKAHVAGYLLNMTRNGSVDTMLPPDLRLLGEIPYFEEHENEIGSPERLASGPFARAMAPALRAILDGATG